MIHALIQQILHLVGEQAPDITLSASPLSELQPNLPVLAAYAGELTTRPMDPAQPLQARRVPVIQCLQLTPNGRGPFKLDHRPYRGSLSVHVVETEQHSSPLNEGHYTLDSAAQTITFADSAPASARLSALYDITGLALVQEFTQELFIEVRAVEPAEAESLAALAAAMVLTDSDGLAHRASASLPTPHAGRFRASSVIQTISLKCAESGARAGRYTLTFIVQGQLKMIREMDKNMM